jgi:cytochrome P450
LAKITPQWLIMIDMLGYRTTTIHHLHQKYGSSVRIGPNEISYSNSEIVKELYSQQTHFMKAPFYETFVVPPVGIFSMRDKMAHSQRRRLLSHAFSQANLYNTEPIIKQIISKLVVHLHGRRGEPTDMLLWFRLTAFDIVGSFSRYLISDGVAANKADR